MHIHWPGYTHKRINTLSSEANKRYTYNHTHLIELAAAAAAGPFCANMPTLLEPECAVCVLVCFVSVTLVNGVLACSAFAFTLSTVTMCWDDVCDCCSSGSDDVCRCCSGSDWWGISVKLSARTWSIRRIHRRAEPTSVSLHTRTYPWVSITNHHLEGVKGGRHFLMRKSKKEYCSQWRAYG